MHTPNEREMRRAFRLSREALEKDIHAHKLTLEEAIMKFHTHLDALGFQRSRSTAPPATWIQEAVSGRQSVVVGLEALAPVLDTCNQMQKGPDRRQSLSRKLHLEGKKNKSVNVSCWLETLVTPGVTADPRIAHPDPDDDSEAEAIWNPRICYTDLSVPCSRQEWLRWVSKAWGHYCSLKAQEAKLKQDLKSTIVAYEDLISGGILNDAAFTPRKYGAEFNRQVLNDMDEEMSICRKLRSRFHEILPAFEWCD